MKGRVEPKITLIYNHNTHMFIQYYTIQQSIVNKLRIYE